MQKTSFKTAAVAKRLFLFRTLSTSMKKNASASINGVSLHYETRGDGPHAIVCIPGALGTVQTDFAPQLQYFGEKGRGFTIVAFDPRGYGQSRPAERFKRGSNFFLQDARDAHTLMQHLSFPKYSVLGWSDGGIAGLFLSVTFPQAVRSLVAWGANAFVTDEDVEMFERTRDVATWSAKMREPLAREYGREGLQALWSNWMECILEFKEDHGGDICTKELRKIVCPTLLLHGTKDPLVPGIHPEYLREHVRGSQLEVFEEGKHNIHLRHHEQFNAIVDRFLQK